MVSLLPSGARTLCSARSSAYWCSCPSSRPRCAPRSVGTSRSARSRRHPDIDGRRVSGAAMAGSRCLPAGSRPAGDVRCGAGVRDGRRAADRRSRCAAADTQQRARNRRVAGRPSRRGVLADWLARLPDRGAPSALLAGSVGIWLFYVQHQFEDAYCQSGHDWNYADAGLRGSSHLKLPRVLQFFTGNIGLHHVHHLNPRIPNYNLQLAHGVCHGAEALPLGRLRIVRLKLRDERAGRLVTLAQARRAIPPAAAGSQRA
jgi:Fatty acid desaturase